jgi:hypothetical protein
MRLPAMTIMAAFLVGCSDSTPPAVINGTYPLRTYRYEPLPGLVSETTNHSVEITGGSITLDGDMTFHSSYAFQKYDWGSFSTVVVDCTGYWTPTETSPQGGQMITLTETSTPGCGDRGTAEWDRHNRLTIVWIHLGDTQHAR